jgi:peptidoglycan/xylan/chitin deacetylase (PgdA/CDA1 family)
MGCMCMNALVFCKGLVCGLLAASSVAQAASCAKPVYLTFDTGNMRHAELIAQTLAKHQVKASFFLANEAAYPDRRAHALDDVYASYWQARAKEGHAFGSHTWDHGKFLNDVPVAGALKVSYQPQFGPQAGKRLLLDEPAVCLELKRVDHRFKQLTGKSLDPIWRAPGGRTTPGTLTHATSCGYRHVHWAKAGFLGDELASETHPNDKLLAQALANIQAGDILMAHLGIWSRKDPFAPMFDPLIQGLKAKGFCFETLRAHPGFQ